MFRSLSIIRSNLRSYHTLSLLKSTPTTTLPGSSKPSDKVLRLAEEIPTLNLLEVNDLLKLLQGKLGLPELSMMSNNNGKID